jgi:hypothetical protein
MLDFIPQGESHDDAFAISVCRHANHIRKLDLPAAPGKWQN